MQEGVDDAGVQNLVNTLFGDVPPNAQSDVNDYPDLEIPLLQFFSEGIIAIVRLACVHTAAGNPPETENNMLVLTCCLCCCSNTGLEWRMACHWICLAGGLSCCWNTVLP